MRKVVGLLVLVLLVADAKEHVTRKGLYTKCKVKNGERHCRMFGDPFQASEPFIEDPRWHNIYYGPAGGALWKI